MGLPKGQDNLHEKGKQMTRPHYQQIADALRDLEMQRRERASAEAEFHAEIYTTEPDHGDRYKRMWERHNETWFERLLKLLKK